MAFAKPNGSGLLDKYNIITLSNHLAELKLAAFGVRSSTTK